MSEDTQVDVPAAAPKGSPVIPILLGVNSVALVGVLVVVMMRGSGSGATAEKTTEEQKSAADANKPGPTLHLSDFTARLHGEGDRYARLSIEIEVANDKDKEDLNGHVPQIRDSFISLLSDSSLDDLNGSDGIGKLKEKLRERLGQLVQTPKIRGLYITDLVVQ